MDYKSTRDSWSVQLHSCSSECMPAQNIHVLKNIYKDELTPWFSVDDMQSVVLTPEYKFYPNHLKRFTNE